MIKIEEIQKEINALSVEDFKTLRDWITEKEWKTWEKEIINDSESGNLDFLIEEAEEANYKNKHHSL